MPIENISSVIFQHYIRSVQDMLERAVFLLLFIFPTLTLGDTSSCNDVIKHSDVKNNFFIGNITTKLVQKREVEPIFIGHPKTRQEIWHQKFRIETITKVINDSDVLVQLLHKIVDIYLKDCVPIIIYDKFVEEADGIILQRFFQVYIFLLLSLPFPRSGVHNSVFLLRT